MAHAHHSTVRGSVDLRSLVAEAEPDADGVDADGDGGGDGGSGGSSGGGGGGGGSGSAPPPSKLTRTSTMELKHDLARGDALKQKRNALTERIKSRYAALRIAEFPAQSTVLKGERSKLAGSLLKVAMMPPMQLLTMKVGFFSLSPLKSIIKWFTIHKILRLSCYHLPHHSPQIKFVGEQGVDEGGLFRNYVSKGAHHSLTHALLLTLHHLPSLS